MRPLPDGCGEATFQPADTVHLYLEESFTFVITTPEAAVALAAQ